MIGKEPPTMSDEPYCSSPPPIDQFVVETTQNGRLLRFTSPLGANRLLAHRLHGKERLGRIPYWTLDLISYDAGIDERKLIGHPVSLAIRLEDGNQAYRHGLVQSLSYLGADGGLHDWQLVFAPWIALLNYREDCRIWMDTTIIDVLANIFEGYPEAHGCYRFDLRHDYTTHTYLAQVNESDLNFVQRWCEHEGIFWYVVHDSEDHTIVFTDDVRTLPESSQSTIRFHTQSSTQTEDSIVQWCQQHRLHSSQTHFVSRNYRYHQHPLEHIEPALPGSTTLSALERYSYQGQYAWNHPQYASRLLRTRMEQQEAESHRAVAIGGIRRLAAGQRFTLSDHPVLDSRQPEDRQFSVIDVELFAESNLPIAYERRDAPGGLGSLMEEARQQLPGDGDDSEAHHRRALSHGFFLSRLECQRQDVAFRSPPDHRRPDIGLQTAVVVNPPGHEVYTDRLNRIHVRFHWDRLSPDDALCSCWLRVMHASSGNGWGSVNIPRAGEEVLVGFMDQHLDRPVVLGQLYGGHQPRWHSTGIMSGIRTKEIRGSGYNQMVMDDATGQLRTQLASSESDTQLNLGYLIDHQQNTRGLRRGTGFELRTDAYGAIRARHGLYLSSWGQPAAQGAQLDAEHAWEQLKNAHELNKTLSDVAKHHDAEALAGTDALEDFHRNADFRYGEGEATEGNTSHDHRGAGDTQQAIRSGGRGKTPGFNDALVLISAPDGIATTTPASTHLHSAQQMTISTGEDVNIATGKSLLASIADKLSLFVHRAGIKLIAAGGRVDIQAQQDEMELQAKHALRLSSTDDAIIVAGKKHILLTSGDAYIRLADGNIEIHAPQRIDIKGANKTFSGPTGLAHTFKDFPEGTGSYEKRFTLHWQDTDIAASNMRYRITKADGSVMEGISDEAGNTSILDSQVPESASIEILGKNRP